MKKCPKCQTEYSDDTLFCYKCGVKLVEAHHCPECGKEIDGDEKFCPHCGVDLVKKNNELHTKAEIEKYRDELRNLKNKKRGMLIAGLILLILGVIMFVGCVVGLVFTSVNFDESGLYIAIIVLTSIGILLSGNILVPIGIILLIVQAAVFTKKISNRERAIKEYEK